MTYALTENGTTRTNKHRPVKQAILLISPERTAMTTTSCESADEWMAERQGHIDIPDITTNGESTPSPARTPARCSRTGEDRDTETVRQNKRFP